MIRDFGMMTKVLFSSIRGKRDKTAPARSAPSRPSAVADLSTSFGEKSDVPPWFTLVRRKPVELPADLEMPPDGPQFDKLSPEALIAMAEGLLGGGLFSSFGQ